MNIILNKNLLSLILHWFKPSFISIFTYDEFIVKNDSITKEGLVSICFKAARDVSKPDCST